MKKWASILLMLVYLYTIIAQGNIDIPVFGFTDNTYIKLWIKSDCDAWIYMDEKNYSEKTPFQIKVFNPGSHMFMLKRENMECCKKEIRIYSNFRCINFDINSCDLINCSYEIAKG